MSSTPTTRPGAGAVLGQASPPEYLDQREADGLSRDVVWRLLRQLPGRPAAGKEWNNYLVGAIELSGGEQCPAAPQLFRRGSLENGDLLGIEVRQDAAHGFGSAEAIREFVSLIGRKVKLMGGDPIPLGSSFSYRKRVRVHEKDRTLIYPNNN